MIEGIIPEEQEILITDPEPLPASQSPSKPEAVMPRKKGDYEFPSLELLNISDSVYIRPSNDELFSGFRAYREETR